MILFPNAKINIGLNILNKRPDGFHNIETIMFPIPLTDVLTINQSVSATRLTITGLKIDGDTVDNLIVKAYKLLLNDFQLPPVEIHLHKTIPFGAGMGGGSADAAFMLKGLNQLFKLNLNVEQLESYAANIGSDCPFFIKNIPALATGRGEILNPVPVSFFNKWLAIIVPDFGVSTKEAYSAVNPKMPKFELKRSIQKPIGTWKKEITNNFEDSVFSQKPSIGFIKDKLYESGALYASLSGSGAACYGIFDEKPQFSDIFDTSFFIRMYKL